MKITADLHIHTPLSSCCRDGRMTPPEVISFLAARGMKRAAFSDHVWMNPAIPPSKWYSTQNGAAVLALKEGIRNMTWPLEVLVGCEADMIAPGKFGITPEAREKFDLVMLSTDHFHMRGFVAQPPPGASVRQWADHLLEFFRSAATSGLADVLVHPLMPLGVMEIAEDVHRTFSDNELLDAFSLAASGGCAIEFNAAVIGVWVRNGFSTSLLLRFYELARQAGCYFTFGSDAHSQDAFESAYSLLEQLTDMIGLRETELSPWVNGILTHC